MSKHTQPDSWSAPPTCGASHPNLLATCELEVDANGLHEGCHERAAPGRLWPLQWRNKHPRTPVGRVGEPMVEPRSYRCTDAAAGSYYTDDEIRGMDGVGEGSA